MPLSISFDPASDGFYPHGTVVPRTAMDLYRNLDAFLRMRPELERTHHGRWVLFYDGELIDRYDRMDSATTEAVMRFGEGPFLIRQLGDGAV